MYKKSALKIGYLVNVARDTSHPRLEFELPWCHIISRVKRVYWLSRKETWERKKKKNSNNAIPQQ